jgi:hypothetical protein
MIAWISPSEGLPNFAQLNDQSESRPKISIYFSRSFRKSNDLMRASTAAAAWD